MERGGDLAPSAHAPRDLSWALVSTTTSRTPGSSCCCKDPHWEQSSAVNQQLSSACRLVPTEQHVSAPLLTHLNLPLLHPPAPTGRLILQISVSASCSALSPLVSSSAG